MQLPDILITAAGSNREFNIGKVGLPTILVFHGQDTSGAVIEVHKTVRKEHPHAEKIVVASIIDLRSFPKMFHGMVKPELEKAYNRAAADLQEGLDPADYVIILPDWDGKTHDSLGIVDSVETAAVVVADESGAILGSKQGGDLGAAALEILMK